MVAGAMLEQILEEMRVPEEILGGLDDDQKQTLFYKIRQEQIRRWKLWNNEHSPDNPAPNRTTKRVKFMRGLDGEPWVWVMGEEAAGAMAGRPAASAPSQGVAYSFHIYADRSKEICIETEKVVEKIARWERRLREERYCRRMRDESEDEDEAWEERERKAKLAELEMKESAMKVRKKLDVV